MSCGVGKQRISTQRIRVRCLFTHQIARTAKTSTAVNVVFAMKFVLFSFFFLPSLLLRGLNQTHQSIHMPIITSSSTTEARDNANTRKGGRPFMCSVTCGVRCERIRDPRFTVIDVVAWHALAWASNATNEVTSPFSVCILRILDNEYERSCDARYMPRRDILHCHWVFLPFFFSQSMSALVNERCGYGMQTAKRQ